MAGDISPEKAPGGWDGGDAHVPDDSFPRAAPNPNLAIGVGGVDPIVGHLQRHHHRRLGLEVAALGELRHLPHADGVAL